MSAMLREGGPTWRSAGRVERSDARFPSPLWGGVRGGGTPRRRLRSPPPCPSPTRGEGTPRQRRQKRRAGLGEAPGRALGLGRAAGALDGRRGRLAGLAARGARAGRGVGGRLGGAGHGGDIWRVARLTSSARTRRRRRLLTTNAEGSSATKVAANRCLVHEVDGSSKSCGRGGRRATLDWLFGRLRVVAWRLRRVGALGDRGRGHRASVGVASPILVPVRAWTRSGSPTLD